MNEQFLDRDVRDVFGQGPQTAPSGTIDRALLVARRVPQRRPRFARLDPRAWPPQRRSFADPQLRRSARVLALAGAALLLTAIVVGVGAQLLQQRPANIELTRAGALEWPVTGPKAALLPDGRILLWGQGPETIFDPRTGGTDAANLAPFDNPDVIGLADGGILVAGELGSNEGGPGPDAIGRFDPETGRTTLIAELAPSFAEAHTVLDDGRVLITGGADVSGEEFVLQSIVRLFDPESGAIETLAPLLQARSMHAAIAIGGGRVLIVGGAGNLGAVTDVEVYDVAAGISTSVGVIAPAREITAGPPIELADRRILIPAGRVDVQPCGETFDFDQATWIFDPASDRLSPGPTLPHPVEHAVALRDGRFVIFGVRGFIPGGCDSGARPDQRPWLGVVDPGSGVTLETRDPMTGIATLPIQADVSYGAGVLLPDGRVALIGDDFENHTNNAIDILTVGR